MANSPKNSGVAGLTPMADWQTYFGVVLPDDEDDDGGMLVEDMLHDSPSGPEVDQGMEVDVEAPAQRVVKLTADSISTHQHQEVASAAAEALPSTPQHLTSSRITITTTPTNGNPQESASFELSSSVIASNYSARVSILPSGGRKRSSQGIRISKRESLAETMVEIERYYPTGKVIMCHKWVQVEMSKNASMRKTEKDLKTRRSGRNRHLSGPWEGASSRFSVFRTHWRELKYYKRSTIERKRLGIYRKKSGGQRRREKLIKKKAAEEAQKIVARASTPPAIFMDTAATAQPHRSPSPPRPSRGCCQC